MMMIVDADADDDYYKDGYDDEHYGVTTTMMMILVLLLLLLLMLVQLKSVHVDRKLWLELGDSKIVLADQKVSSLCLCLIVIQ